jgi:hypothetical protein
MNPLENFDPGIHDYQPYAGQPQSVDADIVDGDFDESVLTIVYSDGKTLEIPLNANPDLFSSKPLDPQKVLRKFNRRHKSSGRLIPFVIYENTSGVSDLDLLSEEDLALMGLPRFDPELTPHVMYFLSPDFKMKKLSMATLQLAAGMANPFPCTEVDEQGNLNASFSFSNCALPLLLKAHAAHSQRQANKPPVPAPAHPAAEGTSQHAEPGGKSDPAGSDAAHSQTPAGKPGPAKVHEPAKQAEKAAEGATHDKAPAKPPADYIHKEGTIAEAPTGEGDHEAVASEEGVGSCSGPPCPNIGVEFANELKDHPDLAERNKAVQALRATDLKKAAREGAALIRDLRAVRIRNRAMAAKGQSALTSGDTAPATRKTPTPDQGAGATRKPPGKTIDRPVKTPREARPVVERQPAIDRLTGRPLNPSSARELLHLRLTDMAARNIQPADLGYSENAWKAMERDYEHDPQRALADLESRLDRRDARPHLVEGDALTEEQENQDPESPRHPLDLPEYQDAIDLARERMRTAPQVRTPKTGANAGEVAQSGYRSTKRFPHSEEATERAGQEGREAGHEPEPHEFDRSANAGDSGQVRGSHAEKQAAQLAPNEPVGVSKPMCSDCIIWFRHIAVKRGIPQVVADPVFTRVFMPDGTVHRILNPVRPSAAGQGGNR